VIVGNVTSGSGFIITWWVVAPNLELGDRIRNKAVAPVITNVLSLNVVGYWRFVNIANLTIEPDGYLRAWMDRETGLLLQLRLRIGAFCSNITLVSTNVFSVHVDLLTLILIGGGATTVIVTAIVILRSTKVKLFIKKAMVDRLLPFRNLDDKYKAVGAYVVLIIFSVLIGITVASLLTKATLIPYNNALTMYGLLGFIDIDIWALGLFNPGASLLPAVLMTITMVGWASVIAGFKQFKESLWTVRALHKLAIVLAILLLSSYVLFIRIDFQSLALLDIGTILFVGLLVFLFFAFVPIVALTVRKSWFYPVLFVEIFLTLPCWFFLIEQLAYVPPGNEPIVANSIFSSWIIS